MLTTMNPIPVERCIGGRDLTEPRLSPDGTMVVFAQSGAGGAALMLQRLDDSPVRQLTSWPTPRTGRGLGGGCWSWTPDSSAVVYAAADGNLWLQPIGAGGPRVLTATTAQRPAQAPAVSSDGLWVVYVIDQAEVWATSLSDGSHMRMDPGTADFCFDPRVASCSTTVFWQAWNVPDMPWDRSRLQRATFDGEVSDEFQPNGAVQQIANMPDGEGIWIRDDHGFNNLWIEETPLVEEPFEHAGPAWGLGQRSYALSPDGAKVAFTRNERGFGRLCVVDVATREVTEIARGVHGQLSWRGSRLCALRTGAKTPTQIVLYNTETWERQVLAVGPVAGWEDEDLVEPELVDIRSSLDGETIHARLYRANEDSQRLLVWVHGGPTDQWMVTFMPRIAYWRSRGWNILVPDHRGSTGHGRAYQQAMNGRWGELDVADIADCAAHAHATGMAAPDGTALIGASAGGFTVLGVIAQRPELAAAAVVSYPVSDLFDLSQRSHRFERHYNIPLVGPEPPTAETPGPYRDRSPINFAALIRTPLLVFHGDADPVVPVEQSHELAQRIEAAGGNVTLVVYPGEGHGFRKPEHQLDEYRQIEVFLERHVATARVKE
jgi:dipeptidyl aminopeptidase/acylaminoacyl peptidase